MKHAQNIYYIMNYLEQLLSFRDYLISAYFFFFNYICFLISTMSSLIYWKIGIWLKGKYCCGCSFEKTISLSYIKIVSWHWVRFWEFIMSVQSERPKDRVAFLLPWNSFLETVIQQKHSRGGKSVKMVIWSNSVPHASMCPSACPLSAIIPAVKDKRHFI